MATPRSRSPRREVRSCILHNFTSGVLTATNSISFATIICFNAGQTSVPGILNSEMLRDKYQVTQSTQEMLFGETCS